MSGVAPRPAARWKAVDPHQIAVSCSPRHVQSVLEDARDDILALLAQRDALLNAVLNAMPYVTDAAQFPEQFKPGVVASHMRLIEAAVADVARSGL